MGKNWKSRISLTFRSQRQQELGGITLYALVIIPVAVTLSVLCVDVAHWYSLRQSVKQEAQRVAALAIKALPDQERVYSIVNESIASSTGLQIDQVAVWDSGISLSLQASFRSNFDHFLNLALGESSDQVFTVREDSTVQVVPVDTVLIINDGRTLRPGLTVDPSSGQLASLDAAWGTAFDWPASSYFQTISPPEIPTPLWSWSTAWNDQEVQRWLTQACFNPVLVDLKLSAISLSDHYLSMDRNRLAVLLTPGNKNSAGGQMLRRLRGGRTIDEVVYFPGAIGGFPEETLEVAEAHWNPYVEMETLIGSGTCALFSDPNFDNFYSIPSTNSLAV